MRYLTIIIILALLNLCSCKRQDDKTGIETSKIFLEQIATIEKNISLAAEEFDKTMPLYVKNVSGHLVETSKEQYGEISQCYLSILERYEDIFSFQVLVDEEVAPYLFDPNRRTKISKAILINLREARRRITVAQKNLCATMGSDMAVKALIKALNYFIASTEYLEFDITENNLEAITRELKKSISKPYNDLLKIINTLNKSIIKNCK